MLGFPDGFGDSFRWPIRPTAPPDLPHVGLAQLGADAIVAMKDCGLIVPVSGIISPSYQLLTRCSCGQPGTPNCSGKLSLLIQQLDGGVGDAGRAGHTIDLQ